MPTQRFARWCLALAGLAYLILPTPALAQGSDVIFGSSLDDSASFEDPFGVPRSELDVVRFLEQATFGARPIDIVNFARTPYAQWLEQQRTVPATLSRVWLEAWFASQTAGIGDGDGGENADRIHRWFNVAVTSNDILRQKIAYALSQIVVMSDRDAFLQNEAIMMAEWNDILVRNALGNYRDLIRETTLSPMMGRYLTTLRNRKFEVNQPGFNGCPNTPNTFCAGNNGVQPDENYAREIMQLFTVGLVVRNADFSLIDDPGEAGVQAWETYDEETISTLARAFTGLSHNCSQGARVVGGVTITRNCGPNNSACVGNECRYTNAATLFNNDPPRDPAQTSRQLVHPDWYEPMVCYPRYHDIGRTRQGAELPLDDGTYIIPPGTPAPIKLINVRNTANLQLVPSSFNNQPLNCDQTAVNNGNPDNANSLSPTEQGVCINYCNAAIDSSVDMLFNHPNTAAMVARGLIQRLVTSNPSPQYIERVANVFANNGSGVRGDLFAVVRAILLDGDARRPPSHPQQPVNFGKPREPLLKLVALWRALGAVSGDTGVFASGPLAGQPSRRRWHTSNNLELVYVQRPLGAPSVFNFYEPDYKAPGAISDTGINGQPSSEGLFSPEFQIIHEVSVTTTTNDLFSRLCAGYGGGNCSGAFGTPPNNQAYFPPSVLDTLPTDPSQLIEFLNVRLMGGTMTGTLNAAGACPNKGTGMKGLLLRAWMCAPSGTQPSLAGLTGGTATDQQRRRALYLLHLIASSPEYGVQR
jgi:uncharacterized protein (DUF1800 family)